MKTDVYSWRLSSDLKTDLEREARARKLSISAVLDTAVREWLVKNARDNSSELAQRRLHATAQESIGSLAGRNPRRAESAREGVRERLLTHRDGH